MMASCWPRVLASYEGESSNLRGNLIPRGNYACVRERTIRT